MKLSNSVFYVVISTYFLVFNFSFAMDFSIKITPEIVLQGEPFLVEILDKNSDKINSIYFDNKKYPVFNFKNKRISIIGADLNLKPGDYELKTINNGAVSTTTISILKREKYEESLPVPESLGGNSKDNQTKIVNTLAKENNELINIKTFSKNLWKEDFVYPIANPIVTDVYGYSRNSGYYSIPHKGTDFRAKIGTKVLSSNRGIVRVAKKFTAYGRTVVVDHGFGIMTFYLHLSKIKVNVGELVSRGQIIGLSGDTGFAEAPHLHFSVRINNYSIDPIKFLELFK